MSFGDPSPREIDFGLRLNFCFSELRLA